MEASKSAVFSETARRQVYTPSRGWVRCPQASAQVGHSEPCRSALCGRREARSSCLLPRGRPARSSQRSTPSPRAQSGAEGSDPREDRGPRPLGRSTYLESGRAKEGPGSGEAEGPPPPGWFCSRPHLRPVSVAAQRAVPRESPRWAGRGLRRAPSGSSPSPDPRGQAGRQAGR